MTIKYYGYNAKGKAITVKFYDSSAHNGVFGLPVSYCVWIVPGTVDLDGNSIL